MLLIAGYTVTVCEDRHELKIPALVQNRIYLDNNVEKRTEGEEERELIHAR